MKQPKTPRAPGRPPSGKVSKYETERQIAIQKERKLRLANDRAEGGLLDAKAVQGMVTGIILQARTRFLGLPAALAARFSGAADRGLLLALDAEVRAILEALATDGEHVTGNSEGST